MLQMPGTCSFKEEWLQDRGLRKWIKKVPGNQHGALCILCKKTVDITTMGKTALSSHASSQKHRTLISGLESQESLSTFLTSPASHTPASHSSVTLNTYVTRREQLTAETWWCFKTVDSNFSYHSNEDISLLFGRMFPDSNIAQNLSLAETKSMYITCYGIAPYLKKMLEKQVKDDDYVLLFDESLNKEIQKKQTDFWIRLWDGSTIQSRYYTSDFLGHGTAINLLESLHTNVGKTIGLRNLLQVSMDGPNVNLLLFEKLEEDLNAEFDFKLLNTGTCGLHVLNNAFKRGADSTEWEVGHFLFCLHKLFDESPARRENYMEVSKSDVFPLPSCCHRWLENSKVAERAISVLSSVEMYVKAVRRQQVTDPKNKSFQCVKDWVNDKLAVAKLSFFTSIASFVEPFLTFYQTDHPVMPFLSSDLETLLRNLMKKFLKSDVLEKASSTVKLLKIDLNDTGLHKSIKSLDIGFVADHEIRQLEQQKSINDRDKLQFKMECKKFLVKLCEKLFEKSPLCYSLVRNLKCLDPERIVQYPADCVSMFKFVLDKVADKQRVSRKDCDVILNQFSDFVAQAQKSQDFNAFRRQEHRLDCLFYETLGQDSKFKELWNIVRKLLLLSHGQASVERVFSINKEVSGDNISEHNIIARRLVKDHLLQVGHLK